MTTQHDRATGSDIVKQLAELTERLAKAEEKMDHFISHDRLYPIPGCSFCEVRRAA